MIIPPLLLSPTDLRLADTSAEIREAPHVDVRSESPSNEAVTSYARPVALAYLIPMSVTATSIGLFYFTRTFDRGPTANGFVFSSALGLMAGIIAPPIVHLSHGNVSSAAFSFTGSLLSTAIGGFVGLVATTVYFRKDGDDASDSTDFALAAIGGVAAGALVFQGLFGLYDTSELAYERREKKAAKRIALKPSTTVFAVPHDDGAVLGVTGMF